MTPHRLERTGTAALLILVPALYCAVSLRHLAVVPPVYEDEPAHASTAWKLAGQWVFGSDVFAGYAGIEHHDYRRMPLYPSLLAAAFRLAGCGLFQARLATVLIGCAVLALTVWLARRLSGDWRVAAAAAAFLVLVRLTGTTPYQLTGILFLDLSRIARSDLLVPVPGLAALLAYVSARQRETPARYVLGGALCGLAGLGHLYGVFWLPVLLALVIWDQDLKWRAIGLRAGWIAGGFVIPWIPYAIFVAGGFHDWRAQMIEYGERFRLLDPWWYLRNLMEEPRRYGPGLGSGVPAVFRAGFWATAVMLPWVIGALLHRSRKDRHARVLLVPLIGIPVLFALLIRLKPANYLLTVYPLLAIAVAWGAVRLWDSAARMRFSRACRAALLLAALAVVAEGASRISVLEEAGRTTTPYGEFIGRVRALVPERARVLALHRYWFGLQDHRFRSFIVPIWWADPRRTRPPLPFGEALDRIEPDVVLVDGAMQSYLLSQAAQDAGHTAAFHTWLAERNGRLAGRVTDDSYGSMEVWRIMR